MKPQHWLLLGFTGIVAYLITMGAKKHVMGGTVAPAATPYQPSLASQSQTTAQAQGGTAETGTTPAIPSSSDSADWLSTSFLPGGGS